MANTMGADWKKMGSIAIAILFGLLLLIQLINRILLSGSYNPNIEGIESTFVYYIQRALDGEIYYQSPVVTPFFLHQYPPVYTALVCSVLQLLNVQVTEVHYIYAGARGINLLVNLVTVGVLYHILRRYMSSTKFQSYILSGMLFLSFFAHNYAVRADSLKTLFVIITLFFSIKAYYSEGRSRGLNILLAALFTGIAVFTKQDAFSYTGIIPLSFWLMKERKLAVQFFFGAIFFVLTGLLVTWCIYGYHYWENVVLGLKQGTNWAYFVKRLPLSIPVAGAFLLVTFFLLKVSSRIKKDRLAIFLIVSSLSIFCIASVSLLKWGSSPVYYMDFFILLFLLTAIMVRHLSYMAKLGLFGGLLLLLVYDYSKNINVTRAVFSFEQERLYEKRFKEMQRIAKSVIKDIKKPTILCLEKDLTNHIYPYGLFPTFEAEFPLYISCDRSVFNSLPEQIFTYSSEDICKETRLLIMKEKCAELPQFLSLDCLNLSQIEITGGLIIYNNR